MYVLQSFSLPVFSAEGGPDLILTGVELSDYAFKPGDVIWAKVTIKNIGTGDRTATSRVAFTDPNGCSFGEQLDLQVAKGANGSSYFEGSAISPGEEAEYVINNIQIQSEEISFTVNVDSSNRVAEANEGNNTSLYSMKSAIKRPLISVTDIELSKETFDNGNEVELVANLSNDGLVDFGYSNVTFNVSIDGKEKKYKKAIYLSARERKKITIGSFKAESQDMNIKLSIKPDKVLSKENILYGEIEKRIASVDSIEYIWDNAYIANGGCAYIYADYEGKNMYLYTDMDGAGVYKYNYNQEKWYSNFWHTNGDVIGMVQSMSVAAKDPNLVFAGVGKAHRGRGYAEQSDLYRSKDGGETWEKLWSPVTYYCDHTNSFNTVMVDPNNSDVLYLSGNNDGVYVSENATGDAPTFEKVNLPGYIPAYDVSKNSGIVKAMVCDRNSTVDGKSKNVYIAVSDKGLYKSSDGGKSFQLIPSSPLDIMGMEFGENGELFIASAASNREYCGLYIYDGERFNNISPEVGSKYYSISVDPNSKNRMLAATEKKLFYSIDSGKSWKNIVEEKNIDTVIPWYGTFANLIERAYFDPRNPQKVWFSEMSGAWMTEDVNADSIHWTRMCKGHEEFAIEAITCPEYEDIDFYTAIMDRQFAKSENAFEYTETHKQISPLNDGYYIDYSRADKNLIFVSGGTKFMVGNCGMAYSYDRGASWTKFPTMPVDDMGNPTHIGNFAVSSNLNENGVPNIVALTKLSGAWYTGNLGETWERVEMAEVTSYPSYYDQRRIVSDPVIENRFYLVEPTTGKFYVSSDGGKSFTSKFDFKYTGVTHSYVACMPYEAEKVVVSLDGGGLFYSANGGESFTKIENVEYAKKVATGIGKEGSENGTLFVHGIIDGTESLFRSDDLGKTWFKIFNDEYDQIWQNSGIDASKTRYGVVYWGTAGTGIKVGMPKDGDFRPINIKIENNDGEYVRSAKDYTISGYLNKEAILNCTYDGKTIQIQTEKDGKFSAEFDLVKQGKNEFIISCGDKSVTHTVYFDPNYVNIEMVTPENITVSANSYLIEGKVNYVNKDRVIEINGVKESIKDGKGNFSKVINLNDGANTVKLAYFDDSGNKAEKTIILTKDIQPPKLEITSKSTSEIPLYTFTGKIDERTDLYINNVYKGTFNAGEISVPLALDKGSNTLSIRAVDQFENENTYEYNVAFNPLYAYPADNSLATVYSGSVQVDGDLSDWGNALNRVAIKNLSGDTFNSYLFGLKSDGKNLYVGVRAYDDYVYVSETDMPENFNIDNIDLYFDVNGNRTSKYEEDDKQMRFTLTGSSFDATLSKAYPEGVKNVVKVRDDGYDMEIVIPLSYLGISYRVGGTFNFNLSSSDCDNENGSRDSTYTWVGDDSSYKNTSLFGTCQFE